MVYLAADSPQTGGSGGASSSTTPIADTTDIKKPKSPAEVRKIIEATMQKIKTHLEAFLAAFEPYRDQNTLLVNYVLECSKDHVELMVSQHEQLQAIDQQVQDNRLKKSECYDVEDITLTLLGYDMDAQLEASGDQYTGAWLMLTKRVIELVEKTTVVAKDLKPL